MLKALELVGFKSFADRTRFDFPAGITVVVGPNGSGKSNIVDAIKWVLGAQSAKSLRGADMADVIFKGSAAGGRKPANSAEATLIFDNSQGQLPGDTPEVQVTRRVYRSGESEYLINRQPCRLKDIKDLFRGTGVGVDAYSLIEQGKVDRMLQASPKDRRAIFEEAAGISRFKAKKVEAERRLARVDQNLLRLGDIVDEVRGRYQALQNQADKARRYREMTQRLSLLRTQIGIDELETLRQQHAKLRDQVTEAQKKLEQLESEADAEAIAVRAVEDELLTIASQAQSTQQKKQDSLNRIASLEAARLAGKNREFELESEGDLLRVRLRALQQRAIVSSEEVERNRQELQVLEREQLELSTQLEHVAAEQQEIENRRHVLLAELEKLRGIHLVHLRSMHDKKNLLATENQHKLQLEQSIASQSKRIDELSTSITEMTERLLELESTAQTLEEAEANATQELEVAQARLETARRELTATQSEALHLQGSLQGVRERLSVLQQLETQQEGVSHGAQQLLELAKQHRQGPWESVLGLLADLIDIDLHLAPLIDVALGNAAETIILRDGQIVQMLCDGSLTLDGRVSLLRMDRLPTRRTGEKLQLDGLRGVIGRADRLVRCADEFQPLVKSLLGTTWLVDSLTTALDLSHLRGIGLRFVTAACERVDADGTLTLGALKSALGLVVRRSEMSAARDEIKQLSEKAAATLAKVAGKQQEIESALEAVRTADEKLRAATKSLTLHRSKWESAKTLSEQNKLQIDKLQSELQKLVEQKEHVERQLGKLESEVLQCEQSAQETLGIVETQQVAQRELDRQHRETHDRVVSQRVLLAKHEQRVEGCRVALEQLSRDRVERQAAVDEARGQIASNRERRDQLSLDQLNATQALASIYLTVESLSNELQVLAQQSEAIQVRRTQAQKKRDSILRQVDKSREKSVQFASELAQVEHTTAQHLTRFREDYEIDLENTELLESTAKLESRSDAEAEAAKLRQEISQVGAVNMEALHELDELQTRFETLDGHYRDLTEAKDTLHRIIAKINQDSRRLFLETLEAIRTNFQTLYRKSFGGGHADIVLEEGEDVLECGVEIVATPPGKTALSNSLLSGGEKALTAVALIMAIFQFRPSPFCVLDEVDAPFDEANIGRFVTVLKDFLDWTKFIVVTHSKKTMTAANTLYGVTMQESGVSTQVSVRFEDVGEDGEILTKENEPSKRKAA